MPCPLIDALPRVKPCTIPRFDEDNFTVIMTFILLYSTVDLEEDKWEFCFQ